MARRRWMSWSVLGVVLLVQAGCGGGDEDAAPSPSESPTTTAPATTVASAPPTTAAPPPTPEGVETFVVVGGHSSDPIVYPQIPPVGGIHALTWQSCTFYDRPVSSEAAVHSLEHGAIWVTYRPDVPADELVVLARFARRASVLVSRWDDGLPAPIVASSWGRQLKLESATDPRLVQFYQAFTGRSPEPSGSCS